MSKWSQVTLLVGLAVGCAAIWSVAAPVGLTGDLVTGSWIGLYMEENGFQWPPAVGCTGYCVAHMDATGATFSCSTGGPYACLGGTFLGAQYHNDGYTVHATGPNVCAHVYDDSPAFWFCEVDLREAEFY